MMTDSQIEQIALANGFALKTQADGAMALNPYVFNFARALIEAAQPSHAFGPTRMWIDQPSSLQPHHKLHGTNVLAHPEYDGPTVRVYFLTGNVVSQQVLKNALSHGWVNGGEK